VAGSWVAAQLSVWLIFPALLILIGLPSVFSTPGDKKKIIVATPGPLRDLLEIALHLVAVAGAWIVWPGWIACCATIIVLAAIVVGLPRTRWLLSGVPVALGEAPCTPQCALRSLIEAVAGRHPALPGYLFSHPKIIFADDVLAVELA